MEHKTQSKETLLETESITNFQELSSVLFSGPLVDSATKNIAAIETATASAIEVKIPELSLNIPDSALSSGLSSQYAFFTQLSVTEDIVQLSEEEPKEGSSSLRPHSLILSERNKANELLETLISELKELENELDNQIAHKDIVCPYEKTIREYLGPNFVCPSINDLDLPEDFQPDQAIREVFDINERQHNLFLTQLQVMSAEAADMSFPGITSQHLNNAFAVLSSTEEGEKYVIDRKRLSDHLEFAELIRNIPDEEIIKNPFEIGQKLVTRFIEIHKTR